jgi:thiol-disulfide isomerase/thioredoxin
MEVERRMRKQIDTDWLSLLLGPLALLLLLALGVEALPGQEVKPLPAPGLPETGWLNTADGKPIRLEEVRGKVVLVEFWTFACFNCRNQLPYVSGWQARYGPEGLVVVGVHTPEFDHERKRENVRKAVEELGISFAVVQDNDYATWRRYRNRYWPALYLIDASGNIVYTAIGEGDYERTERRIRTLLQQTKSAGSRPTAQ